MKNGTKLNNTYRIIKPIGMGGLGEIYLGYHENLQKDVVIKKVKDHCTSLVNNRIEVDILKGLHHTYLPQVYDFIETEEGIFTVMDYISGHDLKYYIDNGYCFSEEQLIFWMKQLCQVLDYLHNKKPMIIHCDIKPANIMITDEGNVCLIDFNISLDGENNKDLVGLSSFFASPEQVKKAEYKQNYGSGDRVKMDERTDIYSVGAVFYYLMCGKKPNARTGETLLLNQMPHTYSDSLANIVDKAMAYHPTRRFRSAEKMLSALQNQEKWTTEYMKFWKSGIMLDAFAVSAGLVLLCCMFLGYQGIKNDNYYFAYDSYITSVNHWLDIQNGGEIEKEAVCIEEAKKVVSEGILILNQVNYKKNLEKNPSHKVEILHRMGQAALYMEEYTEAKLYLENALEYESEHPLIYRDLAVVDAKNGKIRSAYRNLEYAIEYGLSEAEGLLLKTEIAISEESYENAWNYAMEAAGYRDSEIVQRTAYYILQIEQQIGNTDECIDFLLQQEKTSSGIHKYIWMRKAGELYFKLYENGDRQYLPMALQRFELIYANGYAQLNDKYNLTSCYMESGRYSNAKKLLLEMQKDYEGEYKIAMRLAYVILRQEEEKSSDIRDYRKVVSYFEEAKKICMENGLHWNEDVNMIQLDGMIEQLKVREWLN